MTDVLLVALSILLAVSGAAPIVRWPPRREKFCSYCGAPMEWSDRLAGFDPTTGRPRLWRTWDCSTGLTSAHDEGFAGRYVS